jgi:hypothetical protein
MLDGRRITMKKFLLALLLAMLSFFMFVGISQAGQCIYLGYVGDYEFFYDSSDVKYAGDIVSYVEYDNDACEDDGWGMAAEIDCARRMGRIFFEDWSRWESISPGSIEDTLRIKFCR